MRGEGSIKSSKLGDKLKVVILESNCGQRNKTKAAVPITRQQDKKERKEGLNYAVQHSLVVNRIVSINHQRVLVTDGRSPQEEEESTKELKRERW